MEQFDFDMNNKRKNFIILQLFNQIQQDNADARDDISKSVATICNEGDVYFEQVLYILFFDAVFISNESYFSLYFDQFSD